MKLKSGMKAKISGISKKVSPKLSETLQEGLKKRGTLKSLKSGGAVAAAISPTTMDSDPSVEDPSSVEYQERAAAERLKKAIKNRRK